MQYNPIPVFTGLLYESQPDGYYRNTSKSIMIKIEQSSSYIISLQSHYNICVATVCYCHCDVTESLPT